jgi:hypothetical protein
MLKQKTLETSVASYLDLDLPIQAKKPPKILCDRPLVCTREFFYLNLKKYIDLEPNRTWKGRLFRLITEASNHFPVFRAERQLLQYGPWNLSSDRFPN